MAKMTDRKSRTLFVRNLPYTTTNEKLAEIYEHIGPVKTAFMVVGKESGKNKGYGYVQFSMLEDAVKAVKSVNHCDGRKIFASFANAKNKNKDKSIKANNRQEQLHNETPEQAHSSYRESTKSDAEASEKKAVLKSSAKALATSKLKPLKRCRLIVRNLTFKCKEKQLRTHFEKYGDISEVSIPFKKDGLSPGFGFVQFTQLHEAQKAVAAMNGQTIMGRPVAVDWAVAKDRFVASAPDSKQNIEDASDSSEEEEEDDSSEEEEEDEMRDSDSESDATDSSEKEEENELKDSDSESDATYSSEKEVEDELKDSESESAKKTPRRSDVEEGRTLFVRNVPFDAEEEELLQAFEEFGEVAYARLVVMGGRPRGTAFVQFKSRASAEQCLSRTQCGDRDDAITLHGRQLLVALAVSREQAQNKKSSDREMGQKDNRNLFLAREGLIRAGTQAAIGISGEDLKKRLKVEQMKRQKLSNINIFVSSTRLCVHNLPTSVNENELRKVLKQTVDDSAARITECRVMRNMERTNGKGMSKSLGYAFVNFSTHEHALKALRGLNNSTVYGDKKRPIVEFSLENRKALEAKQRRMEKSKIQVVKRKAETEGEKAGISPSPVKKKARETKVLIKDRTQDQIARSMHSGPKGLPKRMGPKIRHHKRGKAQKQDQQRKVKKHSKVLHTKNHHQPRTKAKKLKNKADVTDRVDKMIAKRYS